MTLIGYVDDSGSGEGKTRGNIFVLAGLLSSARKWERFSDKFARVCSKPPAMPDFKMRKAIRLKGDGGKQIWTEAQRDARIGKLARLIRRKADYAVWSTVAWPNYELVVRGKVPPEIDNPYFLLFFSIIVSFAAFMDKAKIDGTVDWVFDEQGPIIEQECIRWYHWIKDRATPQISRRLGSTPIFRSDTKFLPLKGADIYAWQLRRHLDREQPKGIQQNKYLNKLLSIHGAANIIEGEHLENFIANKDAGGFMLRAKTRYFLPPTNRFKRLYNGVTRAIGL